MKEIENEIDNNEETVDFKLLIKKYTAYWYYFILSVSVCLFIVINPVFNTSIPDFKSGEDFLKKMDNSNIKNVLYAYSEYCNIIHRISYP